MCHSWQKNYILKDSCSRKIFACKELEEQGGTRASVSKRNHVCFIDIKWMYIYMPKNKFFILYIGLLSIILLYNFTTIQYIEGRGSRKKQMYLRLSYLIFLIITWLLLHITMLYLNHSY